MVNHKQARANSGKYYMFQYQKNISMAHSEALAKAESEYPFLTLAWKISHGQILISVPEMYLDDSSTMEVTYCDSAGVLVQIYTLLRHIG